MNYRTLLDSLPHDQQVAAIGASNYKLLEAGIVQWDDIVTPSRVRPLREVVAIKKLSIKRMENVGIKPRIAEQAYASVHTPEHELVEQHRRELIQRLTKAGLSQQALSKELASRLAARVAIAPGEGFAGGPMPGAGGMSTAELAALLGAIPLIRTKPASELAKEATTARDLQAKQSTPAEAAKPFTARDAEAAAKAKAEAEAKAAEAKAAAKAAKEAKAAAKAAEAFPKDPNSLEVVRQLGGSTGAELVRDANGKQWVRKRGKNAGHLREEAAADDLYRTMGLDVPRGKLYETSGGPIKLTEFQAGQTLGELERSDPAAYAAATARLRKGFVADALMGNWDVIGMGADNILVTPDGRALRIDNGGSLRYRAQGALKSASQFGNIVGELSSLRNHAINPAAAKVFGSITDAEIKDQIKAIARKEKAILKAAPAEIRDTLKQRIANLKEQGKPPKAVKIGNFKPTPASEFRTFNTTHEADEYTKKINYAKWGRDLTPEQRNAIGEYKGHFYGPINKYHRNPAAGPGWMGQAKADEVTKYLDEALRAHPTPHAMTVVRWFDLADVGLKYTDVKLGMPITDVGYVSTSVNPQHIWGGHRFEIRVPAGTPAGYVKVATSSHQNEYELLLGREASDFRVVELKQDKDRTIVLELVPQKPKGKAKP